jgi:hypothetical protein
MIWLFRLVFIFLFALAYPNLLNYSTANTLIIIFVEASWNPKKGRSILL